MEKTIYKRNRTQRTTSCAGEEDSYVDDERTQLVLLQRDDFVIAGLLRQLQKGARRRQPQPGHVWFTGGREDQRRPE